VARAHLADACEVGNLRARIGDRLDEHEPRPRRHRRLDRSGVGRVDERDVATVRLERLEEARRVAEEIPARHDVIARARERQHDRADRRHPGGEAHRRDAAFHRGDLGLQGGRRRIALPAIDVAGLPALEDRREVVRVLVGVGDRHVERLVQRPVLDRRVTVGVEDRGREAARRRRSGHGVGRANKKPVERGRRTGFVCPDPVSPGSRRTSL
jgi:hypothetical protein